MTSFSEQGGGRGRLRPKTKLTITQKKLDMNVDDTPYEGMNVTGMPMLVYSRDVRVAERDGDRIPTSAKGKGALRNDQPRGFGVSGFVTRFLLRAPGFPDGFLQDFKNAQSDFAGYNICYLSSVSRSL